MPYRRKGMDDGECRFNAIRRRLSRITITVAILCLQCALTNAQEARRTTDSSDNPHQQVRLLCEEASSIAAVDHSAALECTREAMKLAKRKNDAAGMALSAAIRAMVHVQSMQWSEALRWYGKSLARYRGLKDTVRIADLHCRIGDVHRYTGDLADARVSYTAARELLTADRAPETHSAALFGLAAVLQREDRSEEAIALYRRCAAVAKRNRLPGIHSRSLNNIGAILHAGGDYPAAVTYYSEAVTQARITGNARQLIRMRINLATAHRDAGNTGNARRHFEGAFSQASKIRNVSLMDQAHDGLVSTLSADTRPDGGSRRSRSALPDSLALQYAVGLTFEHETSRHEREFRLLQEQQKLQELALARERESTRRLQLEVERSERDLQLLKSEHEMSEMQLDVTDAWLDRERLKSKEREELFKLSERTSQLEKEARERETMLRNFLIGGLALLLIIGFLIIRRFKDRRRAIELKAQIAQARASALESEKRSGEFEARKRFTHLLMDSQEQERKRIAADLHDGIGQDLLVIKNRLTLALREQSRGMDPSDELEEISVAISSSLQDIRRISRNLRPTQLDRIGLTSSIDAMIRTVRETGDITINSALDDIDGLFSKEREIDIYRIIQEGLNNIIKHSTATQANITIQRQNGDIQILMQDNGSGFGVSDYTDSNPGSHGGFGLRGLYERTEILGGNINIESSRGSGTSITVFLPVPDKPKTMSFMEQNKYVR